MFKKVKRLLRLRNKSGFTLVEVIIACALLGILILGVCGFASPILSGVREKEQNARAVMLSEAIDSYIANSIQYAFYVQTFSYCASSDTDKATGDLPIAAVKYSGSEFEKYKDKGLSDMLGCLKNDLAGEVFELKCIGIRWKEIPGTGGRKKLMLTNEKVDQTTGRLYPDEAELVFDPVFYDGLYPIVKFENYSNQYQLGGVDQVSDDKLDIAPGLKITTEVYLSDRCYNAAEVERKKASATFSGVTFTEFPNIKSNLLNKGVYKIQPEIWAHEATDSHGKTVPSYMGAYGIDLGYRYTGDDGGLYYYPNTFIYYIARKTKTGKDPDTSAPASSSSTSEPDPVPAT